MAVARSHGRQYGPAVSPTSPPPRSPRSTEALAAKLLKPFTDVEPEEVVTGALLTVIVFVILTSYYLLKVTREPLILVGGGAEVKSYASAGQAFLLVFVTWGYRALAKRFERLMLMRAVYLFFAAVTAGFGVLALAKVRIGVPFYLYVGVFSLTVIAQFWSFANDVYTQDQGKRLFAIIGIGGSLGAMVGAPLGGYLFKVIGPGGLMLLASGLLASTLALIQIVDAREGVAAGSAKGAQKDGAKQESAPALVGADKTPTFDRYLWLVAILFLLLNWVNTLGEYVLDRTLLQAAAKELGGQADITSFIAAFKGSFFFWVNAVGVSIQLFIASRFLKRFGVRVALFVLPLLAFGVYSAVLVFPVIAMIRIAKIAENSVDYSLQATTNQALYLVTTRKQKYVAKNTIDTFFVRAGDICAAAVIWAGTQIGFGTKQFVLVSLTLVLVWLGVVVLLRREHVKKAAALPEQAEGAKRADLAHT